MPFKFGSRGAGKKPAISTHTKRAILAQNKQHGKLKKHLRHPKARF